MTAYPQAAIPALPVRDVARSSVFYHDVLGFTIIHEDDGFAVCERDAVEVHLWQASDVAWQTRTEPSPVVSGAESFIAGSASCRIAVVGIDTLYQELQPQGLVHPNAPLSAQAWGTHEFGILDPDNNLVTFFERV